MKRTILLISIGVILTGTALPKSNPQDCKDALPICTTIDSTNIAYLGAGNIEDEINKNFSCLDAGEKNSVWYVINVQSDGYLGFLITPVSPKDDYDWAVFNLTNSRCSDIRNNPDLEVSCNYSQILNYKMFNGKTGPTGDSTGSRRGMNEGPFNDLIPAKKGEVFVILVSNYEYMNQSGYKIDFGYSSAQIFDNYPPTMTEAYSHYCNDTIVTVTFSENVDCSTVEPTDFVLTGPGGPYQVTSAYSESCLTGSVYDREFKLVVTPPMPFPSEYELNLTGEVSDVCGNYTDLDQIRKFTPSDLNVRIAGSSDTACYNTPFQLTAGLNGTAPITYQWSPATVLSCTDCSNPKATITQNTTVHVVVTDANNCTGEDSIRLYVRPLPEVTVAKSDYSICENSSVQFTASTNSRNAAFQWTPVKGLDNATIPNPVATPATTTTYTVTVTDTVTGCANTADVHVEVYRGIIPEITMNGTGDSITICSNEAGTIDAGEKDPSSSEPYVKYKWYLGDSLLAETGRYLKVGASGSYVAEVFNSIGCLGRDTLRVTLMQSPEYTLHYDDTTCVGQLLTLSADVTKSLGGVEFKWFDNGKDIPNSNSSKLDVTPDKTGAYLYTVEVKDSVNGCITSSVAQGLVLEKMDFELDTVRQLCYGNTLRLTIGPYGGKPGYSYSWSPTEGISFPNPQDRSEVLIAPDKTTEYELEVEDQTGCIAAHRIRIDFVTPGCLLKPSDVSYASYDRNVEIAVKFSSEQGIYACAPEYAKVYMSVDMPIFNPQYVMAAGKKIDIVKTADEQNRKWRIGFELPGSSIVSGQPSFFGLWGDMILGNIEQGTVTIDSVNWGPLSVEHKFSPGTISFSNLCNDGTKRLLTYNGLFSVVSIAPNPADKDVTLTLDGPSDGTERQVIITDMLGRTVYSEKWKGSAAGAEYTERKVLTIGLSAIGSGMYRICCCSGAGCESDELIIIH